MSLYVHVLFFAGIVPFILSFYPPLQFYRRPVALLASIGMVLVVFGLWDVFATLNQHWSFASNGIIGTYMLALPLEEWAFFIVIPFCCLFTWEVIKYFWE